MSGKYNPTTGVAGINYYIPSVWSPIYPNPSVQIAGTDPTVDFKAAVNYASQNPWNGYVYNINFVYRLFQDAQGASLYASEWHDAGFDLSPQLCTSGVTTAQTLETLPALLWNLHLAHSATPKKVTPLFISWMIPPGFDDPNSNITFIYNDDNTGGADWQAWGPIYGPVPVGGIWHAPSAPAGYCLLGHMPIPTGTVLPTSALLLAHESICLRVPALNIGSVDGNGTRPVFMPDPSHYDHNLYTPLGIYFFEGGDFEVMTYVVLKCMLQYTKLPDGTTNPVYINENGGARVNPLTGGASSPGTGLQMSLYQVLKPPTTWKCYNIVLPTVTGSETGFTCDFGAANFTITPEFDPWYALKRIADQITQTSLNVDEGVWQGWLDATTKTIVVQRVRPFMDAVCNTNIVVPFFPNICACLDKTEDARLKKIDPRLTVACYSAKCLGGNATVYKPPSNVACPVIEICNQQINLQNVTKADITNVTFTCNNTSTHPTPTTDTTTDTTTYATPTNTKPIPSKTTDIIVGVVVGVVLVIIVGVLVVVYRKRNKTVSGSRQQPRFNQRPNQYNQRFIREQSNQQSKPTY